MSNSKNLVASALTGLVGGLGGLRQEQTDAARKQRLAYINAQYYNNVSDQWITAATVAATATGTTANAITISGKMLTPDLVEYDPVRERMRKKDEFQWLRDRVEETCWRPAA